MHIASESQQNAPTFLIGFLKSLVMLVSLLATLITSNHIIFYKCKFHTILDSASVGRLNDMYIYTCLASKCCIRGLLV